MPANNSNTSSFDPYAAWLGIRDSRIPLNHYRLLGLEVFETDLAAIEHAADRQMAHIRQYHSGRYADAANELLNEITTARLCLLKADRKQIYDQQLARELTDLGIVVFYSLLDNTPQGIRIPELPKLKLDGEAFPLDQPTSRSTIWIATACSVAIVLVILALTLAMRPTANEPASQIALVPPKAKAQPRQRPDLANRVDNKKVLPEAAPANEPAAALTPDLQPPNKVAPEEKTVVAPVNPAVPKLQVGNNDPGKMPVPPEPLPIQGAVGELGAGELPPEPAKPAVLVPLGLAAQPPQRVIPDAETLQRKRNELRVLYKTEYASSKPTTRLDLAATLLRGSLQEGLDDTTRYAFVFEARELAATYGDPLLALQACSQLHQIYGQNLVTLEQDSLQKALRLSNQSADYYRMLTDEFLVQYVRAIERGNFSHAVSYANSALVAARKAEEPNLIAATTRLQKDAMQIKAQYLKAQQALTDVFNNSPNVDSAREFGIYYFGFLGDYEQGLDHFAKCLDPTIKELTKREQRASANPRELLALGDQWWSFSESFRDLPRTNIRQHAADFYQRALPSLSGLEKVQIEKRLKEVEQDPIPYRYDIEQAIANYLSKGSWKLTWQDPRQPKPEQVRFQVKGSVNISYVQNWTVEGTRIILWGPRGQKDGDVNYYEFQGYGTIGDNQIRIDVYQDGQFLATGQALLELQ